MNRKKKISIKDVALEAGVSVSAVSAVLNKKVGKNIRVGNDTQDKIRNAANKMGYVPNPAAQNLVSGRSHIVSVFTYEAIFPLAAESEFYSFLLGIEKQSEVTGYDLLLLTNRKFRDTRSGQREVALNRLKLGDGGILIGIERQTETLNRLIDEGFPLVFIGRRDISGRSVNMVNYDYRSVIEKLIKLALLSGHRGSLYIRMDENTEPYVDRQEALNSALLKYKEFSNENIIIKSKVLKAEDMKKMLAKNVTLLILERKTLAIQFESLCLNFGIKIGRDISFILLEDQWFSSNHRWTCWSNVRDQLGMKSLNLLDDIINNKIEHPTTLLIEPVIIKGSTLKKITS